jgi:hypothetical protein
MSHPIPRWSNASALVLAPAFGLVAACATPGLSTTARAQLASVAAHPERFQLYAFAILISSYLMVPAVFGLMALLRRSDVRWAYLAGGVTLVGMVIAVGDAATELMYWKMGSRGADLAQMTALSDRYDAASGWVYALGGLSVLVGTGCISVGLWRTRVVPRWTAAGVVSSMVLNIGGFAAASQPVLILSYAVMLVVMARAAIALLDADSDSVGITRSGWADMAAQAR